MEIGRLRSFLRSHRRIALDTCIFVYQWEGNPRYSPLTDYVFSWLEEPETSAVTSTVTMTELLVHPYRNHDEQRVNELLGLFSTYPNLEWVPPHLEIADLAAQLRALHRLRTPDALQAGTAVHSQATAFITNDRIFERVPNFDTLILDQLV